MSTRETGFADGDARERPVFRPGQPACRKQSWALATVCAGGAAGLVAALAAHRSARGVAPRVRRAARPVCCRPGPGARRPHQGHRRLAACPETWPAVPPTSGAARGHRPDASLPRPGAIRIRRWCAHRVPVDARERVRAGMQYLARHLTIARLPTPGPPGRGHDTGAAVTCAFTAMARI